MSKYELNKVDRAKLKWPQPYTMNYMQQTCYELKKEYAAGYIIANGHPYNHKYK